jgi:hypothetical protein
MNTELSEGVRHTLRGVADEVEVPAIDYAAFRDRVGPVRRRRRKNRLAWGVAAAGATTLVVLAGLPILAPSFDQSDLPPASTLDFVPAPNTPAAFVVGEGELIRFGEDGVRHMNVDLAAPKAAYRTAEGALVLGQDGTLTRLAFADTTEPESYRLPGGDIDSFQVSGDGMSLIGVARDGGANPLVEFDFETTTHRVAPLPASGQIVAVQDRQAIARVGSGLERWYVTGGPQNTAVESGPLPGIDAGRYAVNGTWRGSLLSLPRADLTWTDVYQVGDSTIDRVSEVPVASGVLSPEGDSVVGYTADAIAAPAGTGTADAIELWSSDGDSQRSFRELPALVTSFAWLDNDSVAVLGGDGEGDLPAALDLYTCELSDMTCRLAMEDPTGSRDNLPLLVDGTELPVEARR